MLPHVYSQATGMISFSWTALSEHIFEIRIKTPVTRVGTLYRLTAAIYVLGLDIVSGTVDTAHEHGEEYADDTFLLRPSSDGETSFAYYSARVGVLMETLIRNEKDPDDLLRERNINPPDIRFLFEALPEITFRDIPDRKVTEFNITSQNRTGLLFHITRIFAEEGISILRGTIKSEEDTAKDRFFLQQQGECISEESKSRLSAKITGQPAS
ncbi:MAG TPA: ACT domain-containing protein [Leptospiraceae bacterium]|nr:ACT domain-containing protein [Leptospirales bacterium]HMU84688.1 ACT domain-containing protein [Leptospiraceae bacterium]HMW59460.1 ACT domain-containing protein [Leptospiraceae bacterium]HMX56076.1 ACT domain-containing protein [Leptospiraceae bacterium]HMY44088.1 ACT domain-containing protein [Leptospiraceae bacterium]